MADGSYGGAADEEIKNKKNIRFVGFRAGPLEQTLS